MQHGSRTESGGVSSAKVCESKHTWRGQVGVHGNLIRRAAIVLHLEGSEGLAGRKRDEQVDLSRADKVERRGPSVHSHLHISQIRG